jgi:hypothetical protein
MTPGLRRTHDGPSERSNGRSGCKNSTCAHSSMHSASSTADRALVVGMRIEDRTAGPVIQYRLGRYTLVLTNRSH